MNSIAGFDSHKPRHFAIFTHLVDRENLVVDHQPDARRQEPRRQQALGEILESIAAFEA